MPNLRKVIIDLGKKLDFETAIEVQAAESAYIDVVWFDKRFKFKNLPGISTRMKRSTPNIRRAPLLPIVGFEIEDKTGTNAKHVKGSVTNLDNLGAIMSIIVLGNGNLDILRKTTKSHRIQNDNELWEWLIKRVSDWVYAESQPKTRTIIMKEDEIINWAKSEGGNS